jgi:hypothetical protein
MDKTNLGLVLLLCDILSCFGIVLMVYGITLSIRALKLHFKSLKFPRLIRMNDEFVAFNIDCKPHEWHKTTLALRGLDPGSYLVCLKCGTVSGTPFRLNDPGLEVLRNNIKLEAEKKAKHERQLNRTQEILEADFNYWVNTYLQEFSVDKEKNRQLLRKFSVFTVASVNDAAQRAIRETE